MQYLLFKQQCRAKDKNLKQYFSICLEPSEITPDSCLVSPLQIPLRLVIMQSDRIRSIDFLTAHGGFWPTFTFSMSNFEVKNVENG